MHFDSFDKGKKLTFGVKSWVVPRLLAGVHMNPPALLFRVYFRPDQVLLVPNPSYFGADRSAQHCEAISPFSAPPPSGLQQRPHVAVAWKSLKLSALVERALVRFHSVGTSRFFIGGWRCQVSCNCGRAAHGTGRIVDEGEEGVAKPSVKQYLSIDAQRPHLRLGFC